MRHPRKLKKRIIKTFGNGTYIGILYEYLAIEKYINGRGCHIVYTDKFFNELGTVNKKLLHAHQQNPYITFKNINKPYTTF